MILEAMRFSLYGAIFLSLFAIDYALGNGFVKVIQKLLCKMACFVKKSKEMLVAQRAEPENIISLPMLLTEIALLTLTIAFLNRFKRYRGKDRFDELLQESKESLRQTNEFLEKWRTRRINWQEATESTYLDDEPQRIKPFKLEVPILHMAIIDTHSTTRSQPERGDAGDSIKFTDSALLSVTSLLDDEDLTEEARSDDKIAEKKQFELRNRYLWDVMEEDSNMED